MNGVLLHTLSDFTLHMLSVWGSEFTSSTLCTCTQFILAMTIADHFSLWTSSWEWIPHHYWRPRYSEFAHWVWWLPVFDIVGPNAFFQAEVPAKQAQWRWALLAFACWEQAFLFCFWNSTLLGKIFWLTRFSPQHVNTFSCCLLRSPLTAVSHLSQDALRTPSYWFPVVWFWWAPFGAEFDRRMFLYGGDFLFYRPGKFSSILSLDMISLWPSLIFLKTIQYV